MKNIALLLFAFPFAANTLKVSGLNHECLFDSDCHTMRNCDWSVDPGDTSMSAKGN